MANKRKSGGDGEGINLDSLMDALTNVVAVLILVLILVQADVTQKVQKFMDDLQPATPEEVELAKAKVEELKEKKELLEERMKEEPATPEDIQKEKLQLALLEKSLKENENLLADINELRELEKKTREERDTEREQTVAVQEEIAKLEALLDETPVIKPTGPTVVTIPNSRPIPDDAQVYYALAIKDRIHIIDPFTPVEMFEREFERNRKDWLLERVRQKGADRYIYDGVKIAEYFKTFDWKNSRMQKLEIFSWPTSNRLQLVITPDAEKGGTPLEDLGKPGNAYAKALSVLSQNFKSVLIFQVNPDSFNAYLKARELADAANIAAGWEMSWQKKYVINFPDIEVKRLEEPKPKPDQKKPTPPKLKTKLD
ncbi:hypothetical protein ACFSSA_02435 [Luteolibacter algae]|uniref:Uncharacterized protein n=1 Tax=Luteolibacter algae TaxID=454151 RepID=A0ABW5D499_9BACT